jgi:hypothetical protein
MVALPRIANPPPPVFANLLNLITRRPPPAPLTAAYDLAFVKEVTVRRKRRRNPRMERVLVIGWVLIVIKCILVAWLVGKYHVPIAPMWVIAPSVAFALLCTWVYLRRD